jgi:hypothetical protein
MIRLICYWANMVLCTPKRHIHIQLTDNRNEIESMLVKTMKFVDFPKTSCILS